MNLFLGFEGFEDYAKMPIYQVIYQEWNITKALSLV